MLIWRKQHTWKISITCRLSFLVHEEEVSDGQAPRSDYENYYFQSHLTVVRWNTEFICQCCQDTACQQHIQQHSTIEQHSILYPDVENYLNALETFISLDSDMLVQLLWMIFDQLNRASKFLLRYFRPKVGIIFGPKYLKLFLINWIGRFVYLALSLDLSTVV